MPLLFQRRYCFYQSQNDDQPILLFLTMITIEFLTRFKHPSEAVNFCLQSMRLL
jgi:hypothetical protein